MNKYFYRIVFNKARGILMVVADIVGSHQCEGRSSQTVKKRIIQGDHAHDSTSKLSKSTRTLNSFTVMTYFALGFISFVPSSYATTIVVDNNANKNQRPIINQAANGVTQVDIQGASSSGLSHNKYTQFDVSKKGVILNNSSQMAQTELAGYVKGNNNLLKSGSAKIILNEINSRNASQLAGYIEVAGQKAQVVIANAAGITCNGCGFINADRATLTTGKPIIGNGHLKGYQVEQGNININGKGLDSSRQNYTDLISRTVTINASLWGNNVNVVAGKNKVSQDLKQIDKLTNNNDDTSKPQFAIDVAALGGMYAGKIQMIGTESGVGVHNAGNLGASAGSITISSDGKIINRGAIQAQQDITLNSNSTIDNQKQIYAKKHLKLTSSDNIENNGTLVAQKNITLQAKTTLRGSNKSLLAAGVDVNGNLTQEGAITAQASDINQQGQILATQSVLLAASHAVNLDGASLVGDDIHAEAQDISAQGASIKSNGSLELHADQTVKTNESQITSQNKINVTARTLENNNSKWQSGENMMLTATATISNRNTQLISLGEIMQDAKLTVDNENGQLQAKGDINQRAQKINNNRSEILSEHAINLQANNASHISAIITAQDAIKQQVKNQLDNTSSTLFSGSDITLSTSKLIQSQSSLTSNRQINIIASQINNSGAALLGGDIIIKAGTLSGDGTMSATHNITLGIDNDFKNQAKISASNHLSITSDVAINNQSQLVAGNELTLNSKLLSNRDNAEISADVVTLNHDLITNQGLIDGKAVNITTSVLSNQLIGRIYGTDLNIIAQTLNNQGDGISAPVIAARNNFNLGVGVLNNISHGLLLSLQNFTIGETIDDKNQVRGSAQTINNHSSTIEAQGNLTIGAHSVNNINDNIKTEDVLVDEKEVNEWSFITAPDIRFDNKDIAEYCVGCGGSTNYRELQVLATKQTGTKYNHYIYTQKIYETQVVETDPSKIISGGNLTLITDKTLNNNSHINAGGQLTLLGELKNNTVDSTKKIVQSGMRYYTYDYYSKKGRHYNSTETYSYTPLDEITTIDLGLSTIKDNVTVKQTDANLNGRSKLDNNDLNNKEIKIGSVSTVVPNTTLPDSSLYTVSKETDKNYLIETDSRFINKKEWLSSDYMFEQLKADPNNIQKRLGDGYYEQQLIKEQITALTGQRYAGDYSSDLEQYQALMNNGVEFANNYGLTIGVELTEAQMQALTSDIVWMVSKTVTVNDETMEVLVPQVYIVGRPEITSAGALLSGKNVALKSDSTIRSSGTIVAKDNIVISAGNIENQGLLQGEKININAVDTISSNGVISAGSELSLKAGNDINLVSTTSTQERQTGQGHDIQTVIDKTSTISVKDGNMTIEAGHDINTGGALIINQGENSTTTLSAGNDLNFSSVTTRDKIEYVASGTNYVKSDATHEIGSEIYSQGNINLNAGSDINVNGSTVSAGKALNANADNININSVTSNRNVDAHLEVTNNGIFSKTKSTYDLDKNDTLQNGSALSGQTVNLTAGKAITVSGSQVTGTNDINLMAGGDVTIDAAKEEYNQKENTTTKTSGLMSGGGLGFSIGKEKESTTTTDTEQGYVGSAIGSTNGSVNIKAGQNLDVKGSDVIAKQNINLQGENVNITANDSKVTYKEEYKYEKTGLTVALTGTASDVYDAKKAVDNAKKKGNNTLLALQSIKSGLAGANAGLDIYGAATGSSSSEASIGVKASFGTQRTEREVNQEQHNVVGSGVSAEKNITITATGNDKKEGGDINVVGSEVRAGQDITLNANQDVNVIGAVNTQHTDSDEKSSGSSMGIGLVFGTSGKVGIEFSGNSNFSRERENADGSAWSEGVIDAKNNLTVKTGNNVNVIGGQLKGDSVNVDVGNNLNIQSLQDSDDYDYEKLSASVGGSITLGPASGGSVNFSASKTEMESNWASVTDQSGIYAGSGGFDVTVGNNTNLKGAVIASSAEDKSKNKLNTGTISFEDIQNKADFNVDHVSVNVSVGSGLGYTPMPGAPSIYHNDGSASSTTKSAVEEGTLIVRDSDKQTQNVNDLSRDTKNANDALGQIFDKQKEQDRIDALDLVKDIAAQAKDVAQKYSKIKAEETYKGLSDKERADKEAQAIKSLEIQKQEVTPEAIKKQVINQIVQKDGVGNMGDSFSKGLDAASSIITGIITGNLTGGLAGASAPYLAEQIKLATRHQDPITGEWKTDDKEANLIAHAILGGAVAAAQGNSALAGSTGALTGEAASGYIKDLLYGEGTNIADLTQEQKDNISNLAQIASGLAVAAGGGSISDVGTSVAGSKNAVENNSLSGDELQKNAIDSAELWKDKSREILGEGVTSLIVNTAITVAAEGMSGTVGMVDTASDLLAALVTCTTGDSYCTQAKSDLNKVNDKIGGAFDAVVSGAAWKKLKQTINAAENGDQKAQENVAALLASLLVPAKAGYPGGKTGGTVNKVENVVSDANTINKAENAISDASTVNKVENSTNPGTRPPAKQSEIDVGANLGAEYKAQVSYKDGVEVPYGTKGSVRPDWCNGTTCSIEVKNYNIETNTNNLINNVSKQALDRQIHLPQGMQQQIVIDVRGQNLTPALIDKIRQGVAQKSNGIIKPEQIKFMTE